MRRRVHSGCRSLFRLPSYGLEGTHCTRNFMLPRDSKAHSRFCCQIAMTKSERRPDFDLGLLTAFLVVFGVPTILGVAYDVENHLTKNDSRPESPKEKLHAQWRRYPVRLCMIGASDAWSGVSYKQAPQDEPLRNRVCEGSAASSKSTVCSSPSSTGQLIVATGLSWL